MISSFLEHGNKAQRGSMDIHIPTFEGVLRQSRTLACSSATGTRGLRLICIPLRDQWFFFCEAFFACLAHHYYAEKKGRINGSQRAVKS